jgi:hypothetical protein
MKFPSYVPQAVRVSVSRKLEGPESFGASLESANAALKQLVQRRTEYPQDESLRIEHVDALAHRDYLAAEVACLQRLVSDARMKPAYARLVGTLDTDEQLSGFIDAAWAARMDFGTLRDRLRAAKELAREVAIAAGVLADLLRKAEGFAGPFLPSEFFSIRSLLEKTEHDDQDRDFHLWPGMRRHVLGERELRSASADQVLPLPADNAPTEIEIRLVDLGKADALSPEEEQRNMLRYAWGTAPSMARIIAKMQREALAYVPVEEGAIGAALASRKRNAKAEYVRAFGTLLREVHRIDFKAGVINAMATSASVVLNQPDDDVSPGDVRSALFPGATGG